MIKIFVYPNNSFSVEDDVKKEYKFGATMDFPELQKEFNIPQIRHGGDNGCRRTINNILFILFPTKRFLNKKELTEQRVNLMNGVKNGKVFDH